MLTSAVRSPARSTVARTSSPLTTRPSRRLLLFAHLGWVIAVIIDAALVVSDVPALSTVLHQPCSGSGVACMPAQLSLADFRALGGPGPALNAYVVYALVTPVY